MTKKGVVYGQDKNYTGKLPVSIHQDGVDGISSAGMG